MDLKETIEKINYKREKLEGSFVFSLWAEPQNYEDYLGLLDGKEPFLLDEDAVFFYALGEDLFNAGYRNFDAITLDTFLTEKPTSRQHYDEYGGYATISELKALADSNNTEGYYDQIMTRNLLLKYAKKTGEIFDDVDRLKNENPVDVADAFELMATQIDLETTRGEEIQTLTVTKEYIEQCEEGNELGYSYHNTAPILNYITLGINPGMMLLGGHSGVGKSSMAFEVFILGVFESGIPTAIISNEMGIDKYRNLLLAHILTHDLDYYGLTRKKIQLGKYNDKEKEMIDKALKIADEKYYGKIFFIKMFNNSVAKVIKYLKRLKNNHNVAVVMLDTYKADDVSPSGESMWQELLMSSRRLFQECDRLGIGLITTYQLAPAMINQRYLDVSCLANAKQIKEVYSDVLFARRLWDNEMKGEKYDVKPFRWKKNETTGNKEKEPIELDPSKQYVVIFLDKTRSDDVQNACLLFKWDAVWNKWTEIGYCHVHNTNRY